MGSGMLTATRSSRAFVPRRCAATSRSPPRARRNTVSRRRQLSRRRAWRGRSSTSGADPGADTGVAFRQPLGRESLDRADVVVVGAGTIGGWASYFAKSSGASRVVCLEGHVAGYGASSRAAGIVRAQGGTPAAVQLGLWSIDFYRSQAERLAIDSGFRALGYLLLATTDDDVEAGRQRVAMQREAGLHDVSWLEPQEVASLV